jgi:hypothetical protein
MFSRFRKVAGFLFLTNDKSIIRGLFAFIRARINVSNVSNVSLVSFVANVSNVSHVSSTYVIVHAVN